MNADALPAQMMLSPFLRTDPGDGATIAVSGWNQEVPIHIGSGSEANTLPLPRRAGWRLRIMAVSDAGGARVITVAGPINKAGNTKITLDDVDEMVVLESFHVGDGNFEWRVTANDGATLS